MLDFETTHTKILGESDISIGLSARQRDYLCFDSLGKEML